MCALPAKTSTILNFIADLFESKASLSTARVYTVAIGNMHRENDYANPTLDDIIQRALNGYQRLIVKKPDARTPITPVLMKRMKEALITTRWRNYDQRLFWAALCLAWNGFLRVSEYASPAPGRYDPNRTLRCGDCTVTPDQVCVQLRVSKTDQFGHGYELKLSKTSDETCPVHAMNAFWTMRTKLGMTSKPLFMFQDGTFLTNKIVDDLLKHLLKDIPDAKFTSHSLRIGAATTAAVNNVPVEEIKKAGRWKSNAFAAYIRGKVPLTGLGQVGKV